MRKRNLIASLFLLLFCAEYAYLTANLATRAIENTTQPSFFPWVITSCLTILSLCLLVQSFLPNISQRVPKGSGIPLNRLMLALLLAIIYLALLPTLGFLGANILMFSGLMYLYGERTLTKILTSSFIVSAIIFYIFREIFQIRLPAGVLESVL